MVTCHGEQQYFIKEPEDITVIAGQKVVLPCKVEFKQGLLQWTKDGFGLGVNRDLPGYLTYSMVGKDENREWSLEISSVTIEDDAIYQCQVGAFGETNPIRSGPAHLKVLVPPGVPKIMQGDVLEAVAGVETVLECTSSGGRPAGEIMWKDEEGKEILTNTITRTKKLKDMKTFETISVLRLKPQIEDNMKKIFCTVSSDISPGPASAMTVMRLKYKPRIKFSYKSEALNEGDSFSATCKVDAYPEEVNFSWYLNGQLVEFEKKNTLTISKVTKRHANGIVECQASNSVGIAKAEAIINVKYPPTILTHPNNAKMREGMTAHFSCLADGNPVPRYVWTRADSNEVISFSANLNLVASAQTAGDYKCQAIVEGFPPVVSKLARMSMMTKPQILSDKDQDGKLGDRIQLECKVASAANNNAVSWDKNGIPIPIENKKYDIRVIDKENEYISELFVENSDASDFSSYGCKATNEIGSAYLVINMVEKKIEESFDVLYIVIGVFAIVILLLLLILVIVLCKRRNRSNMKLIEIANDQSKRREKIRNYEASKCDEDEGDEWCLGTDTGGMSGPEPDLIMPLKQSNKLPRNILRDYDKEADNISNYLLTPLEDESHMFNNSQKPFMIQRFEKQPLPSNNSFSSINSSPFSSSLESGNSAMESPCGSVTKQFVNEHEKPFRIKNIHVSGRNQVYTKPTEKAKANIKYTLGDDSDDQYVTLLPSDQTVV
jgi:hypothetical protein